MSTPTLLSTREARRVLGLPRDSDALAILRAHGIPHVTARGAHLWDRAAVEALARDLADRRADAETRP